MKNDLHVRRSEAIVITVFIFVAGFVSVAVIVGLFGLILYGFSRWTGFSMGFSLEMVMAAALIAPACLFVLFGVWELVRSVYAEVIYFMDHRNHIG